MTKRIQRSTIKATALVPNQKVVWRVLDNHLNFVEYQCEWVGTTIKFEISPEGNQTEVPNCSPRSVSSDRVLRHLFKQSRRGPAGDGYTLVRHAERQWASNRGKRVPTHYRAVRQRR